MTTTTEYQELSEAVTTWLHYCSVTGMRKLLTEASMAVPVGAYLSTLHGSEIHSEVSIDQPKRRSRWQIDFVRKAEDHWISAYEAKWEAANHKLIIEDLCRLALISEADFLGRPECFFIFAAPRSSQDTLSRNFNSKTSGRSSAFDPLLSRGEEKRGATLEVEIANLDENHERWFRNFAKRNAVNLPAKIRTSLQGWHSTGKLTCGVWKVGSVGKSRFGVAELEP